MTFTYEEILQLEQQGYVRSQTHPTLPLRIFNYTESVQYGRAWDVHHALIHCRGLVFDTQTKQVVAVPFPKFFNWEEVRETEDFKELEKNQNWVATEKLDGSLIILFNYGGEWIFASKGSFTSEQSVKAKDLSIKLDLKGYDWGCTYLFEIIYPENQIVVNYGEDERLYLLGIYCNNSKQEVERGDWVDCFDFYHSSLPLYSKALYSSELDKVNFEYLKSLNLPNKEGYVVRFDNGYRFKIKFENYVEKHRIVTNTTPKHIWELVKEFGFDDIHTHLEDITDEVYKWFDYVVDMLKIQYDTHLVCLEKEYYKLKDLESRKEFATLALQTDYSTELFCLRDGKETFQHLMKHIELKNIKNYQQWSQ